MDPHFIRLRGPWTCDPLVRFTRDPQRRLCEHTTGLPPTGKLEIPTDWAAVCGADFEGRVRFTRHFNRPTGLSPGHRVELRLEEVDTWAEVWLNDRCLGTVAGAGTHTFEIEQQLQQRNLLQVVVEKPPATVPDTPLHRPGRPGGLVGEVRLAIFPASR